jgi:hypothetical protein
MKFICGLRLGRNGRGGFCNEEFDSWWELADHLNIDHRLSVWIAGGTISQEALRPDRRRRREICGDGKNVRARSRAATARDEPYRAQVLGLSA